MGTKSIYLMDYFSRPYYQSYTIAHYVPLYLCAHLQCTVLSIASYSNPILLHLIRTSPAASKELVILVKFQLVMPIPLLICID